MVCHHLRRSRVAQPNRVCFCYPMFDAYQQLGESPFSHALLRSVILAFPAALFLPILPRVLITYVTNEPI